MKGSFSWGVTNIDKEEKAAQQADAKKKALEES